MQDGSKMMKALSAIVAAAATLAVAQPALAHHSFAMFDQSKEIELKNATVVDWQWTSPHTWLYVIVPEAKGPGAKYSIEGGNPGIMRRLGFGKGSMSAGDKITLYMAPLRSGQPGGSLNAVVLANGQTLGERKKP